MSGMMKWVENMASYYGLTGFAGNLFKLSLTVGLISLAIAAVCSLDRLGRTSRTYESLPATPPVSAPTQIQEQRASSSTFSYAFPWFFMIVVVLAFFLLLVK
jgi:hypothetical protein